MTGTDDTKLRELMLYIAQKSEGDSHFGKTKLFKILVEADFTFYSRTGRSITDYTYEKREFGPIPRGGLAALDALQSDGDMNVLERTFHGFRQALPLAMRDPDLEWFSAAEIAVVDEAIDTLRSYTAKEASDRSHESIGWIAARIGEEIPYQTCLIDVDEPTEADYDHAARLVADGRHKAPSSPLKVRD
jgi:hypothetical protein